MDDRLITLAIHTYDKALALKALLEKEGITVELHNVNLQDPVLSSGVRVRIHENDLPSSLRIVENRELFSEEENSDHIIMVPVDFSEMSFRSVGVAAAMARNKKAKLRLLYSYLDPYLSQTVQIKETLDYDDGEPRARAILKENGERLMTNFRERVRNEMKQGRMHPVPISSIVLEGVPEDAIISHGKEIKPMLVVMGTRSAKRKQAEMIGSVTAEVLDEGRFTVLTVPENVEGMESLHPSNILFFSNLDQDDILAIDALYRMFGSADVKVTIMHVPERRRFSTGNSQKAMQQLYKYCSDNFSNFHFVTVPVSPEKFDDAFSQLRESEQFDLIVAPSRRRSAFSRLFNPGLLHKILFRTDIPMLVIPV